MMPVSSAMPGWRSARNAENRDRASAPAEMVANAHPVASRNRDHRFAGSRSQSWVMASNRAACRPRRAGTPRRCAFQWSPAYSPSRRAAWP